MSDSTSPAERVVQGTNNAASPWREDALLLVITALLVLLLYSNTLQVPLTFDDLPNIEDNPHIHLTHLSLDGLARAGFDSLSSNRPVANISFALNYYIHQDALPGYHGVNLVIHLLTGVFLYLLIKTTLGLPGLQGRYTLARWLPLVTVLLWLVHPLQTQSVTYIVQRMNSLAALFYVLSLLLYARARLAEGWPRGVLFGGCILSGLLALGSKEIAATLPVFILLYEWYFFQDLSGHWVRRYAGAMVVLAVGVVAVAWWYLGGEPWATIMAGYEAREFTLLERVLTEWRVVFFYLSLFFFPHPGRLNLDHDFPLSHSLLEPWTTLPALAGLVLLVVLAVWLARRERLLSFCVLWLLGNLVIESSVIGLELVFEHRMYLPSMLLMLLVVDVTGRLIRSRKLGAVVLCGVVVMLSLWTHERNGVWGDPITLWRDCVAKSPGKARPHNNLGQALVEMNRIDEAINHFTRALQLVPDNADFLYNLGAALSKKGETDHAVTYYLEALQNNPYHIGAHTNLGNIMATRGNLDEALNHYSIALQANPYEAEIHYNLGNLYKSKGQYEDAEKAYKKALSLNSGLADAINNLAVIHIIKGNYAMAFQLYLRMINMEPDNFVGYYNMACLYALENKVDESIDWLKKAIRLGFSDWVLLKNDKDLENIRESLYFKELLAQSTG